MKSLSRYKAKWLRSIGFVFMGSGLLVSFVRHHPFGGTVLASIGVLTIVIWTATDLILERLEDDED